MEKDFQNILKVNKLCVIWDQIEQGVDKRVGEPATFLGGKEDETIANYFILMKLTDWAGRNWLMAILF